MESHKYANSGCNSSIGVSEFWITIAPDFISSTFFFLIMIDMQRTNNSKHNYAYQ